MKALPPLLLLPPLPHAHNPTYISSIVYPLPRFIIPLSPPALTNQRQTDSFHTISSPSLTTTFLLLHSSFIYLFIYLALFDRSLSMVIFWSFFLSFHFPPTVPIFLLYFLVSGHLCLISLIPIPIPIPIIIHDILHFNYHIPPPTPPCYPILP
ncbi:hypothetical protein HOY80DRAFT_679783 [Tuber brumale]|nr:hypothetical protein HOY80DRAFT_679783 [Tuber brumale]